MGKDSNIKADGPTSVMHIREVEKRKQRAMEIPVQKSLGLPS